MQISNRVQYAIESKHIIRFLYCSMIFEGGQNKIPFVLSRNRECRKSDYPLDWLYIGFL